MERYKDEGTLVEPGMGHEDLGIGTDLATSQQDVDVEGARTPTDLTGPSTLSFGALGPFKEFAGRGPRGQLHDEVPEVILLDDADRLALINERQSEPVRTGDGRDASREVLAAIADVRTEGQVRPLHYERDTVQRTPTDATSSTTGGRTFRTATVTDAISSSRARIS